MTMDNRTENANSIVQNHMIWAMGAGLIPVPMADFLAVSAIQLDMVRQLCNLYDIDYKETEGKAMITSLTGSMVAKLGARAIKFIPGVGSVIGGVTLAILSGASTYALGEVFKKHFETGGTFLDFDPARLKKVYNEMFEKGKKYAYQMKREQDQKVSAGERVLQEKSVQKSDPVEKLKQLAKLYKDGVLDEAEFEALKKKLIDEV
ncbi:MAG: DUF697 domain-containing protein [Saprospiraceae bacterium]|nr:DUF697 domain-containing protein [Saprospiraceae bacterium]